MNLRRLNYILIRGDARNWERWAKHPAVRLLYPFFAPVLVLTVEGQLVLTLTLLSGAAGMDVQFSSLYLVFSGLLSLLAAAWLGRLVFARPGALTVTMHVPPRVAAGEPATFTAELSNPGRRAAFALRVFGPFLTWDGAWIARRPAVPVVEPGGRVRVDAQARFLARGHHYVGRFRVASVAPLGLALGRFVETEPVRLMVVPRTVRLRHLPPPPLVADDLGEQVRGLTSGADYELAGLRPYRPGDRIRDLHAFSWARLGEPMVRTFRRAARRRAVVVLHTAVTRLDEEAFEAAVSLAASLVRWALEHGASTTLLVAGASPREVTVGPQSAPEAVALDVLGEVTACAPEAVHAATAARLAELRAANLPIYRVFSSFGPHVPSPAPGHGHTWVVGDKHSRASAQAAGHPTLTAAELALWEARP